MLIRLAIDDTEPIRCRLPSHRENLSSNIPREAMPHPAAAPARGRYFRKRRVQTVHNLVKCCRALLPVVAMALAGCSASQQAAYDNLQDPWRDRTRPRLEG